MKRQNIFTDLPSPKRAKIDEELLELSIQELELYLKLIHTSSFKPNQYKTKITNDYVLNKNQQTFFPCWEVDRNFHEDASALYNKGLLYEEGIEVEKDGMKAFQYYAQAAKRGFELAQYHLGSCYEEGLGTNIDLKEAFYWYQQAANQGNDNALYRVGLFYQAGWGIEKDLEKSFQCYKEAAEQGNPDAQLKLGKFYKNGIGVQKDQDQAFYWYQQAANEDILEAQYALALCYGKGIGTQKDKRKAFYWYQQAANKNDLEAQVKIGKFYEQGIGTQKDERKAFYWYQQAANKNDDYAQCKIGRFYENGIGTKKNISQAIYWYQQAASQDSPDACYQLGYIYAKGDGVAIDEEKSIVYIQQAAKLGHITSKFWLEKQISANSNLILNEAEKSKDCFVPRPFPFVSQIGPCCGPAAFAGGCNYAQLLPQPLYVSHIEAQEADQALLDNNNIVLNQLQYTNYPSDGPVFSIYAFQELAQHYGIEKNTRAVLLNENCTEEEYREALIKAIRDNHVLIVACETDALMPKANKGKTIHWVLVFGVWRDESGNYKISVAHKGVYCTWSIHDLYESNKNLPDENPHKENSSLKEFRYSFFKMKVQNDRKIVEACHHVRP